MKTEAIETMEKNKSLSYDHPSYTPTSTAIFVDGKDLHDKPDSFYSNGSIVKRLALLYHDIDQIKETVTESGEIDVRKVPDEEVDPSKSIDTLLLLQDTGKLSEKIPQSQLSEIFSRYIMVHDYGSASLN